MSVITEIVVKLNHEINAVSFQARALNQISVERRVEYVHRSIARPEVHQRTCERANGDDAATTFGSVTLGIICFLVAATSDW